MATRIVVFPVQGRRWAFGAVSSSTDAAGTPRAAATLRNLWQHLLHANGIGHRAELLTHYASEKMHQNWVALGNAPQGSVRNRVHGVGQRLLSRIRPSELFLKSIPKDAANLEIIYPSSLNPRLVRRRVRHLATSGAQFHEKYMYGSFALLPITVLFGILPIPNIPFFWNLFRAHAHWRALQGSKMLTQLASDHSQSLSSNKENWRAPKGLQPLVLVPSKKLESMVFPMQDDTHSIRSSSIAAICQQYHLDYNHMSKWRNCNGNNNTSEMEGVKQQ